MSTRHIPSGEGYEANKRDCCVATTVATRFAVGEVMGVRVGVLVRVGVIVGVRVFVAVGVDMSVSVGMAVALCVIVQAAAVAVMAVAVEWACSFFMGNTPQAGKTGK
jgi:hypothetical protein